MEQFGIVVEVVLVLSFLLAFADFVYQASSSYPPLFLKKTKRCYRPMRAQLVSLPVLYTLIDTRGSNDRH